jgi:hypothetical protein
LRSEHDELLSQDEQLDVFSEFAAAAADQQPQHGREGELGEGKEHALDAPIARYRVREEREPRSWALHLNQLRSATRSGTRARVNP